MDLLEWIESARNTFDTQLDAKIKVIGVIGKDCPDHGKGDNINSYLRENVFPIAASEEEACSIRAHYSEDEQLLFLVMNGVDDLANMRKYLKRECIIKDNNYFEVLAKSEEQHMRMLHFLFITCHFIIIFEQTSRIDLELMRLLRKVNVSRMQLRRKVNRNLTLSGLKDVTYNNRTMTTAESEGRVVIPRLLIAFQRNNIRPEVNTSKKRELYEKLEKNLDTQLNEILKSYELIESGSSALCQLNETIPCVHLLNPKTVKRDIVSEMFDSLMFEAESRTGSVPGISSNNSFVMFLEDNFRSEKNEITLENVIVLLKCFLPVLDGSLEDEKGLSEFNVMTNFIKRLRENHLEEALRIYTNDNNRPKSMERRGAYRMELENEPVKIRSKAEHIDKFEEAVLYIESVIATDLQDVLSDLADRCDQLWQSDMRACEAVSMMGHPCVLKAHSTFGDLAVPESRWVAHDASNTIISTCICGRKQLVRQEPFSVKEANYDFFENPDFTCCQQLWRHQFQVYLEDFDEKEEILWAARESNSLHAAKKPVRREDELADDDDLVSPMTESLMEDEGSEEDSQVQSLSTVNSSDDEDMYVRPSSCNRNQQSSSKSELDLAVEHAKRLQKLEKAGKTDEFIVDVPNSLTMGKLPLFSSWHLISLGDSGVYNHGTGLKNQPNFKIGGEYLSPAVVYVDVDLDTWNRDLNKVRSEDFTRKYLNTVRDEIARVKLFIGFEYECSRGHRFFVDYNGEPIVYPKGTSIARESAHRSSLGDVLQADLPIRRPCTCRKLPLKVAQLQKIHVVTPKAPVRITIDPKILIPGHEGVYGTGQAPLELHHSKYYILQLPLIYSGPSGTWIPDEYSPDKEGVWKRGAIKVTYKPFLPFRW